MKLFQISILVMSALFLFASPSHADTLLFLDQFTDADWSKRWEVVRNYQPNTPSQPCMNQGVKANWEVKNNLFGITLDGPPCVTEIIPKVLDLTNIQTYIYEFGWLLPETINTDRNVIFIWQNPLNWYDLKLNGNTILLQKVVGGQVYNLPGLTAFYPFSAGTIYHFKITVEYGKKITVQINDNVVLLATDLPPFISGFRTLGLQASVGLVGRSLSYFGDIFVHALEYIDRKMLNIPVFKQTDPAWKDNEYDSAHKWAKRAGINDWGCALTSMAMVMKYYGMNALPSGQTLTPATLNDWLKSQRDGYLGDGLLNWLAITRLTRFINEKLGTPKLEFTYGSGNLETAKNEIQNNRAVILNIPGHFIVGSGISNDNSTLYIQDPFYDYKTFDEEKKNLLSLRLFRPSFTDLSYILITHSVDTHVALKDSSGQLLSNIQESTDQIVDPNDSTQQTPPLTQTLFAKPSDSKYSMEITRDTLKSYNFSVYAYDQKGDVIQQDFAGFADSQPATFVIDYHKNGVTHTEQLVSFTKLRRDLKNLKDLSLIKKTLVYLQLDALAKYGETSTYRASVDM